MASEKLNRHQAAYKRRRDKSRSIAREKAEQYIAKAKKLNMQIRYAKCECCGEKFGYVVKFWNTRAKAGIKETLKLSIRDTVSKAKNLTDSVPSFCCITCKDRYQWTHGGKEKYKQAIENSKKMCTIIHTVSRGSGNFYSGRRTLKIIRDGSEPDFKDFSFDSYQTVD